jgi:hypothetical protein
VPLRLGAYVPAPPGVRDCLRQLFGASAAEEILDRVRVVEYSLFARLHLGAIATTRRRRIFLRGSGAEFFSDPELILHEYYHVLRQWEPGTLTTLRYVGQWLRCGYWDNPFEIEAREFAEDNLLRFRALLSRTRS